MFRFFSVEDSVYTTRTSRRQGVVIVMLEKESMMENRSAIVIIRERESVDE